MYTNSIEVIHVTLSGDKCGFPKEYGKDLQKGLIEILTQSRMRSRFPEDACHWTTLRLKTLGLVPVFGTFKLDKSIVKERGFSEFHNWSLDSKKRIVDLTLPQMNSGLINPVLEGIIIVDPETDLYRRFCTSEARIKWE